MVQIVRDARKCINILLFARWAFCLECHECLMPPCSSILQPAPAPALNDSCSLRTWLPLCSLPGDSGTRHYDPAVQVNLGDKCKGCKQDDGNRRDRMGHDVDCEQEIKCSGSAGDFEEKNAISLTRKLPQEEMDRCYPQKLERGVLPSIDKNKATDFDTVPWKKQPVKRPPQSAPCKKVGRGDITPWVGDSPLDSPFGAIPQSLELHHTHAGSRCCLLYSHSIDPKEESNIVGSGQVGMGSSGPKEVEALTQRSGREDQSRRKPIGKVRAGGKLPPVQSISNLNFSRNFTFSFFQLPPHQLQRYQARSTHVR